MESMKKRYLLLAFAALALLIGFVLAEKPRDDEMPNASSAPNEALSLDIPKTSFSETNQEPERVASPEPTTLSGPTLERPAVPDPGYSATPVAKSAKPEPSQENVVPSPNALSLEIPSTAFEIPNAPNLVPDLSSAPIGTTLSQTPLGGIPTPSFELPRISTITPPTTPTIVPLPNTPVAPLIELSKPNLLSR